MKALVNYIVIILLAPFSLSAQFLGGSGDGHSEILLVNTDRIYRGNSGDGYTLSKSINTSSIYEGGHGDGYDLAVSTSSNSFYLGGVSDGYELNSLIQQDLIFNGGDGDGFDYSALENGDQIYQGGLADGYAVLALNYEHLWTGVVNNSWSESGNWIGNVLPNENVSVKIPGNAIRMPEVGIGLFVIGDDKSANYLCKSLFIENGAILTTVPKCSLINKTEISIEGTFHFKNQTINSFSNIGTIRIGETGSLILQN